MSLGLTSFLSDSGETLNGTVAGSSRLSAVFREVNTDCLSAEQVDDEWDRMNESLSLELRQTEDRVRTEWRASWQFGDMAARSAAQQRLSELIELRRGQRRLYNEAMQHVGLLRGKHIELLEWAMRSTRDGWKLPQQPDSDAILCKSFAIVLDDGEEVLPYRKRPRGKTYSAFFVSNSGNKREDAIDVFTEPELRRLVIGLGYRAYCRNREGTRAGLYTARSPNHVRFLENS